jgi:HAD superfamily hydrolase (TIGR01509 family)
MGPTELVAIERNLTNREHIAAATEAFLAEYEAAHEAMVERNEDIVEILRELRASGKGLALFTGKSRKTLDISLTKLNWQVPFDYIVTGDDIIQPKPSPEGIEQILGAMKWHREETVFVGDSLDDQLAGRDAGILTIAAGWMNMKQDSHEHIPSERVFEQLSSFRAYLAERLHP